MRLTDGKKIVDVQIRRWIEGFGYGPDWSHDFFGTDESVYDAELEAYVVYDLEYCIDYAREEARVKYDAEFGICMPDEDVHVIVEEVEG